MSSPIRRLTYRGGDPKAAADSVAGALSGRFRVETGATTQETSTHLDTPDHRLADAGLTLTQRGRGRRLTLERAGADGAKGTDGADGTTGADRAEGTRWEQDLPLTPSWPVMPDQLAAGAVRTAVTAVSGLRALVVAARTRTALTKAVVRNADDKIVARVAWRRTRLVEPASAGPELPVRLSVAPLRGYGGDVATLAEMLIGGGDFTNDESSPHIDVLAAAGPVVTPAPPMTPDLPASVAIAQALQAFSVAMRQNVPGTLADVDTEFLHELRVAVRRIRSVLKRAGDVLPAAMTQRYPEEFRWVGQFTTPTRDLDVFTLDLPELRGVVSDRSALDPFAQHLLRRRKAARRDLVTALRSSRFADLLEDFDTDLATVLTSADSAGPAGPTAAELARNRIRAAYRRMATPARALTKDTPAADVHDLRKRGKDLRYVLEVFRALCDPDDYAAVISDLKKFQDILGRFQDSQVQVVALHQMAQQMLDAGERRAEPILAVGELAGHFHADQLDARAQLDRQSADYLGARTAKRVEKLVSR